MENKLAADSAQYLHIMRSLSQWEDVKDVISLCNSNIRVVFSSRMESLYCCDDIDDMDSYIRLLFSSTEREVVSISLLPASESERILIKAKRE